MTAPAGLLDRIGGRLFPSQGPVNGLITEEDIRNAQRQGLLGLGAGLLAASGPHTGPRTTLMQAVGQGLQAGQQAQQGALDTTAQRRVAGMQAERYQNETQLAQQRAAARQQILTQHPMPAQGDQNALAQWISTTLPLWTQADPQTAGQLADLLKSLRPASPTPQIVRSISGAALGQGFDPKKTYTIQLDHQGNRIGQPLEEGASANTVAGLSFREQMTPVQMARLEQGIISRFDAQTKNYATAHEAWSQLGMVRDRAAQGQGTPDDLIQLIDAMSRLNNPGAVVRVGTVAITMDKLGSWKQKLENWKSQGLAGVPDPELVRLIAGAARGIAAEHERQYNSLRQKAIQRGTRIGLPEDYMDAVLPNTWEGSNLNAPTPEARLPGETVEQYIARTRGASQ